MTRATPQMTIEAVITSIQERGLDALDDQANVIRLQDFDDSAFATLHRRVAGAAEYTARFRRNGHTEIGDHSATRDEWQPPECAPDGPHDYADLLLPNDGPKNATAAPTLTFVDAASLAGIEPPQRRWLVPNRVPLGNVTLLSGDGAAGKTTIALQLAAATVTGSSWLSALIEQQGPVMFLSAEEDHDELHRRVASIAAHHGLGLNDLAGLHLLGMPGEDALLGAADRAGIVRPTPLFDSLVARASEIRPILVVIEAAADVFGGNENDRGQVRQFIGLLRRLALLPSTPAVVLIAHPSLTGLATGTGTSGSTGWSNSVRSRLYFAKAKPREGDDDAPDDVRELRVMKSNYGPAGEVVKVHWHRGVFVPVASLSTVERAAADAGAEAAYLACLEAAAGQGRDAYPKPGRGYAPKVFADMPQARGHTERALAAAQERLFTIGRIHAVAFGPPSRGAKRIERRTIDIEHREAAE